MSRLSKSRYLAGLQCHKRLYLDIHAPDLASPPDAATQAVLDMGSAVGEMARRCFSGGRLVEADYRHRQDALDQTARLIADPTVPAIFEAALLFERTLVRVDVLQRAQAADSEGPAWRLVEVKSSSRVKDLHLDDLAIQTYVATGAGLTLAGATLMHLNTQYLYPGGEIDLTQLFTQCDVTQLVLARLKDVPARLMSMRTMLEATQPPAIEPGPHCHTPYDCPYWDHCTREKPTRWVYHLPGRKTTAQALIDQGVETIDDIPESVSLTVIQRRVKDNREWIGPALADALASVQYPVHHLDFETFMPAVPRYPGTRPFQLIPVQWSNHIEDVAGEVHHQDYLSETASDPREELTLRLLESLGDCGTICVYSQYERSVLEQLAELFPHHRSALQAVIKRLWDLLAVVQEHYYHPAFGGSYSIKSVLPAVVPALSYDDLEIGDGAVAAREYVRMVFEVTDWVERQRIADALRAYCARDTLGMVELRRELMAKAVGRDNREGPEDSHRR
jgi:hypothetical protein